MLNVLKLLFACLLATAGALEMPVSRRAVLTRVVAAAPLAAVVQQASAARISNAEGTSADGKSAPWMSAANSNTVLGTAAQSKPGFEPTVVSEYYGRKAAIDEWGSTIPSKGTDSTVAKVVASTNTPSGNVYAPCHFVPSHVAHVHGVVAHPSPARFSGCLTLARSHPGSVPSAAMQRLLGK